MKTVPVMVVAGLLLVLLAGCDGREVEKRTTLESKEAPPILIRGLYAFGHEVRALRPCGQDEDLWVIDPSGTLQKVHEKLVGSLEGAPRVFVVASGRTGPPPSEGFGAEYAGAVTIEEIIYVASEGFRCDFDMTRFVFRAYGNEPFWMVEVLPDQMTLSRPGQVNIIWPEVSREISGDNLVFVGSAGKNKQVRLTVLPQPGQDSMSGAYHGHTAVFELNDEELKGVALRGFAGD